MPFGQLFTSLVTVREAIGSPVKENVYFPDTFYNGTPLLQFFTWAFNSSIDFNVKELSNSDKLSDLETTTIYYNSSTPKYPETHNVDTLSIMWYLASFGTLVMFFLIISFSEVCCKKSLTERPEDEPEVSPPPYDLFAPPTYDSLYEGKKEKTTKRKIKRKCEVFVISVFGDKNKSRLPSSQAVQSQ